MFLPGGKRADSLIEATSPLHDGSATAGFLLVKLDQASVLGMGSTKATEWDGITWAGQSEGRGGGSG